MNLEQSDLNSLTLSIAESIKDGTVDAEFDISLPSNWDKNALKDLSEKASSSIDKTFSGFRFNSFIVNEIKNVIMDNEISSEDWDELERPLTQLECFSDPLSTAKAIVDQIKTYLRNYIIFVGCSREISDRVKDENLNVQLSVNLRIISGSIIKKYASISTENDMKQALIEKNTNNGVREIKEDKLYFEYKMSGYFSAHDGSPIMNDVMDEIRMFYGACLAHNLLYNWEYLDSGSSVQILANESSEQGKEIIYVGYTDSDVTKATNLTTSATNFDAPIDEGKKFGEVIKPVISIYSSKNSAKLKTASLWIFRASIGERKIDRILESTIALEVLLGDRETSDRIGLSKLMANRCAYALGKNAKNRQEILDFFTEFYKVRSEIVHVGKFKLNDKQEEIVDKGLALSKRMLIHEAKIG